MGCGAGGQEKGQRIAAATYMKNFLKKNWIEETIMPFEERMEFRNQLVEMLLRVDGLVLKILAEAVRTINICVLSGLSAVQSDLSSV